MLKFAAAQPVFTSKGLGVHLGISPHAAKSRIDRLVEQGQLVVLVKPRKGGYSPPGQYGLPQGASTAAAAGFKAWLRKKGEDSAEGRPPRKPRAVAAPPVPAVVQEPEPAALPSMACGLMSTGELVIEAGGQQLRLDRGQVRVLVDYLDLVGAALKAA